MKRLCSILLIVGLGLIDVGCKSMTPGQLESIQSRSDRPCAGNVYLLRGFIGIWSYGVDHLGVKINDAGVRANVFQEDQWQKVCDTIIQKYEADPVREPLVLIGHSYGADDVLRIAKQLQGHHIDVDLLITLDPVVPPQVSSNIRLCYNIYQPNVLDALPFFRGVALQTEAPEQTNLKNVNIRVDRRDLLEPGTDHFNIEKNEHIHAEVVLRVKEFCPPRQDWLAQIKARPTAVPPAGSSSTAGNPGPVRASQAGAR